MANGGWYGTKEEWARIEAPLIALDDKIDAFARAKGLAVGKNHKGSPDRSMRWGTELSRLIQIYLGEQELLTWNIWICCSRDVQGERFWRREFLVKEKPALEFQADISRLLEEGYERLQEWSMHPELFEFATKLQSWK